MKPIHEQTEDLVQEALAYLDDGPIDYSRVIYSDALYDVCYDTVINNLTDYYESLAEEEKYQDALND